jgi:hypothetical protein
MIWLWLKEHLYIAGWIGGLSGFTSLLHAVFHSKIKIASLDVLKAYQYLMLFGTTIIMFLPWVNPVTRLAASLPAGFLCGFMTTYYRK